MSARSSTSLPISARWRRSSACRRKTLRQVLLGWGPGKFDAEVFLDGKGVRPDGKSGATLIPPAFGLAGVNLHTWTGWGSVTHWNAFVANLEMHGKGTFFDPRLDDPTRFPIAAKNGFGHIRNDPDLITSKLGALHLYQLAIRRPTCPDGSFDATAAARGEKLFVGRGRCAECHVPPLFTEPGWNLHTPEEVGIDAFQANRAPDARYRTTPLKGLWTHTRRGFYHDGRFATWATWWITTTRTSRSGCPPIRSAIWPSISSRSEDPRRTGQCPPAPSSAATVTHGATAKQTAITA